MKLPEGKGRKSDMPLRIQLDLSRLGVFPFGQASIDFGCRILVEGMWHPLRRVCYSLLLGTAAGIEERSAPIRAGLRAPLHIGCWLNGSLPPVLKHGPRSLTCMRVFGCENP